MNTPSRATAVHDVDTALLRSWAVPMPAVEGDKEIRGHVLVLGGSCEMPGAIILAATAALRAGAGKLTIATGQSVAQLVALAMPEARVIGLREHDSAGFSLDAAYRYIDLGRAKSGLDAYGGSTRLKDLTANEFRVGLRYRFADTLMPTIPGNGYGH